MSEMNEATLNQRTQSYGVELSQGHQDYIRAKRDMPPPTLTRTPRSLSDLSAGTSELNTPRSTSTMTHVNQSLKGLESDVESLYRGVYDLTHLMAGMSPQDDPHEVATEIERTGLVGDLHARIVSVWRIVISAHRSMVLLREVMGDPPDHGTGKTLR